MAVNKFDQDEKLNSKIDTKAFSKVGKYIKPQKQLFFEAALMMIIHSVFTLIAPFCLSLVIDICLPQKNTALLFAITGGLVLLYVCAMLAYKRRSYVSNLLAFRVISKIRSDLFSHMQKLPFSFFVLYFLTLTFRGIAVILGMCFGVCCSFPYFLCNRRPGNTEIVTL